MHSRHSLGATNDELIQRSHTDTNNTYFSTTLIETISELLSIDPAEIPLNLSDIIDTEILDQGYRFHENDDSCIRSMFDYGGYTVECCTCGSISIFGDEARHQEGLIEHPASMN